NNATEYLKQSENNWALFDSIPSRTGKKRQELEDAYNHYHSTLSELVKLLYNENINSALSQDTQASQISYEKQYNLYRLSNKEFTENVVNESSESYSRTIFILITILSTILLIVIAVWFGIKRILIAPLNNILDNIQYIAKGDLTRTIAVTGCREVNELADTLRYMQHELA
ncbi:Tar ligand binding domain-containing protein, partial [Morganella morganii]